MLDIPSIFPQVFFLDPIATSLLRIVIGLISIRAGYLKTKRVSSNEVGLAKYKGVIGSLEVASGILVTVGFLTQIGVLVIAIINILGLITKFSRTKSKLYPESITYYILAAAIAISIFFLGPGLFAIDLPI